MQRRQGDINGKKVIWHKTYHLSTHIYILSHKRDIKIEHLENECENLKKNLNSYGESYSIEEVNKKVQNYDELFSKLRLIIIKEGSKRGFNFKISMIQKDN